MLEINKYCFISDKIKGHILIYNSQNHAILILTSQEYDYLMEMLKKVNLDMSKLQQIYIDYEFVVKRHKNCFDHHIFNCIIESMLINMNFYVTFLIIMEKTYGEKSWIINLAEFKECILAIANYCEKINGCNLLLILQCEKTTIDELYEKIIIDNMKNINYKIDIRTIKGNLSSDNIDDKINNLSFSCNEQGKNKKTFFSSGNKEDVNTNIEFHEYNQDENSHSPKNMTKYISEIKKEKLFSNEISVSNVLCPNLMEHFYIIEHAKLVKKCLCQPSSHDNIIGVISDKIMMINENIKKYSLSADRLNNDCYQCRYVYICLGQNCRACLNQNIITCMPYGKFIRMNLNKKLLNYFCRMKGRDDE